MIKTIKEKTIKEILESEDIYTLNIELRLLRNLESRINKALSTQRKEIIEMINEVIDNNKDMLYYDIIQIIIIKLKQKV